MAKAPTPNPRRGEVWLVDFNPAVGAEIHKIRPALIVNLDSIGRLPLRMVAPITDWKAHYLSRSWLVRLLATSGNGLRKDSCADTFQCKSVSLDRFRHQMGRVTTAQIDAVAAAIAMCVGAP